jgi:hypothetical protein
MFQFNRLVGVANISRPTISSDLNGNEASHQYKGLVYKSSINIKLQRLFSTLCKSLLFILPLFNHTAISEDVCEDFIQTGPGYIFQFEGFKDSAMVVQGPPPYPTQTCLQGAGGCKYGDILFYNDKFGSLHGSYLNIDCRGSEFQIQISTLLISDRAVRIRISYNERTNGYLWITGISPTTHSIYSTSQGNCCYPPYEWQEIYDLFPGSYSIVGWGQSGNGLYMQDIDIQFDWATLLVPSDYPTIQSAINAAPISGWTIEVAPGTYNEAIDFKGKAITVKATGARASTIIDGTGLTTSVVRAVTGETSATVLQGFTIRNGPIGSANSTYRLGGGIFISSASPTIRDCAFTANQSAYGGGMYALYSNSLIENCTFSQNSGSADGGGIQLFGGSPIVRNCVVSDNTAGNRGGGFHVVQHNTGAATLDGCTISGNRSNVSDGGGVSMAPFAGAVQKFLVSNCTITNNSAQTRGGGLWAVVDPANPQQNVTLTDNTICNNTSAISKRENVWALFEDGGNTICDCISDISGDGDVDTGDLSYVLLFVGEPTDADFIQPDQDMNGFIDTADVSLVLLNMGVCP